jgi:hypothetical protein
MTASGITAWNQNTVQIITQAFRKMAVINEDETPTQGQYADGLSTLNSMTKEWEATGIHIWTEQEAVLFLQQYQRRYLLGGTTTDQACDANSWVYSQLQVSYNAGASILNLGVTTGINSGDNLGILLAAGNMQWTTVSTPPSGGNVTPAAPLAGPANAQASVITYPASAALIRPLDVPQARRLQYAPNLVAGTVAAPDWGGIVTPIGPMSSRQDFMNLPSPNTPGLVNQVFYNPARDQGEMWVWNVPVNATYALRFTAYRPIQDWVTQANTGDFPQEWQNAIIWNLAKELGPGYSIPAERWDRIKIMAMEKKELIEGWDREKGSVYFGRASSQTR